MAVLYLSLPGTAEQHLLVHRSWVGGHARTGKNDLVLVRYQMECLIGDQVGGHWYSCPQGATRPSLVGYAGQCTCSGTTHSRLSCTHWTAGGGEDPLLVVLHPVGGAAVVVRPRIGEY